jgi:hypothetical protein
MQVTNVYFSKIIKVGERLREFNFRKLPNTTNSFHVDVTDDRGQRIIFTMFLDEERNWKISSQNLPLWVSLAEGSLASIIAENYSA